MEIFLKIIIFVFIYLRHYAAVVVVGEAFIWKSAEMRMIVLICRDHLILSVNNFISDPYIYSETE